MTWQSTSWQR